MGVIILHWGPEEVTVRCLQSLKQVFYPTKAVLLIDNARSLDPAVAESVAPLAVEVLQPSRNLGVAEGYTWGITVAMQRGVDYVLLLNNDVEVDPFFLDHLVKAAQASPGAGLLCPQIVFLEDPEVVWYGGGKFSLWGGIPRHARWKKKISIDRLPEEVVFATGCAMLIDPAVIQAVGSFDSRFFAYCEDLDLSLRARKAGFKILVVPASVVYHAVASGDQRLRSRIYYSTRNLLGVMRKHAAWYHWVSFVPNFLVRWLGYFIVLAAARRRPGLLRAMVCGIWDFTRGSLGERDASVWK